MSVKIEILSHLDKLIADGNRLLSSFKPDEMGIGTPIYQNQISALFIQEALLPSNELQAKIVRTMAHFDWLARTNI
jgi:hypothetical protein